MLRFLSSYLFQNENQPNENDPTSVTSSEQHDGPSSDKQPEESQLDPVGGATSGKEEFMDLEMRDEGEEDDEDDWVLIGENKRREEEEAEGAKRKEVKEEDLRVQVQPEVSLVAAPSTEEEDEDDDDEEEEESEDEEEDVVEEQGLLWENKLIEHPSMSVYVDLATSINSNGVTASCVSLSSIAPATSPGESVIVLEQPDSDEEDDESMDFLDSVVHEPMPLLQTAEQVHLEDCDDESDTENNNEVTLTTAAPSKVGGKPVVPTPPIQNGRRKKGHYPCTSSNSSQMPRRAHLRSCGGSNTSSSTTSSFVNLTNGAPDAPHDAIKRIKRSTAGQHASSAGVVNANSVSACGIAVVNGGAASPTSPPNSNGMINKNLKLVEMFPTASTAAKRRHRRNSPPQKQGATPKGHFLQEARRRQDNQNYTKQSFANNDRRSATQRRVPKNGAGANGGGRAK